MAVSYQDTTITGITYQEASITEGYFDSTLVFSSSYTDLILDRYYLETEMSQVPPPYDNNGYNYGGTPPTKTAIGYINLGNITNYDGVTYNWNNEGSFNSYGLMYCDISIVDSEDVEVEGSKIRLYNDLQGFGYKTMSLEGLSGTYKLKVELYAKSNSPYRGYCSKATVTLTDIRGVVGGIVPPSGVKVTDDFEMQSYITNPGPFDENDYNYNWSGWYDKDEVVVNLGDVTSYTELVFEWLSIGNDPVYCTWTGPGGEARASYKLTSGESTIIYSVSSVYGETRNNGRVVIDLSEVTGQQTLTFTTYAYGCSPYRYYGTRTVLNIKDMYIY